jgi:hypothetical protein
VAELISDTETPPAAAGAQPGGRRRWPVPAAIATLAAIAAVLVVALSGGSQAPAPDTSSAGLVPADALAYVSLSLDPSRPAVKQALSVARRFPDFPLAGAAALNRLGAVISGGRSADYATQISPWLGGEAALALLNTTTSTAGTLIVLDVSNRARAMKFVDSEGAVSHGSYRGTALLAYPSGLVLAFVGDHLALGRAASVEAAIAAGTGAAPSLAKDAVYRRANAGQPAGRVLSAYASLDGVRRLLAPQGGVLGSLGNLLYQPALRGAAISVTPTVQGASILVHSALDPTLAGLHSSVGAPLHPTLQDLVPGAATLMFDVGNLDRAAPQVLGAGSAAGVAGGIGPLLSRLGAALKSEGVNVSNLVSIFDHEAAVAIVPHGRAPELVVVARDPDQAQARTELAGLQVPLARLFRRAGSGSSSAPVFNDRQIAGITVHSLVLSSGLQLDYAVFRGLVVISTSLPEIAAVAQRTNPLSADPGFRATLRDRPKLVTGLVYLALDDLVGTLTGSTQSATLSAIRPDLEKVTAVGLTTSRDGRDSIAQLSAAIG